MTSTVTTLAIAFLLASAATSAAWAAEPEPEPDAMTATTKKLELVHRGVDVKIEYFTVSGGTTSLRKQIDAAVRRSAGVDANDPPTSHNRPGDRTFVEYTCESLVLTARVVSFRCYGAAGILEVACGPGESPEDCWEGGAGGADEWWAESYAVEGGRLVPLTLARLFGSVEAARKALGPGGGAASIDEKTFVVTEDGLAGCDNCGQTENGTFAYQDFRGSLRYDPWRLMAPPEDGEEAVEPAVAAPATTTKVGPRFVAGERTVEDTLTGLVWARDDNGADLDQPAAAAFCDRLTLGGHDDWRLPTIDELALVTDTADRHKPADTARDCVGGQYAYAVAAPFRVTCGLAWSQTALSAGKARAMGFVSGKPRTAAMTSTTNYRALCVRAPR
ncbi:MAG: DUF1566 domain-containing protein [Myxococcales bacterium]|nr:DUF1566 domain-containing protein [Myxococcales bacterium]